MRNSLYNFVWPTVAGLLAAVLILDRWVLQESLMSSGVTGPDSYRSVVAQATPSVVNIDTRKVVTRRLGFLDDPVGSRLFRRQAPVAQRVESSLGSGVIMSADGHIITNNHVIEGAEAIRVTLHDGRVGKAVVIGGDPATDLAILKTDLDNLTPVDIADSDAISVGDVVLSIGNPYGFGHSVSQGIVSGLGRSGLRQSLYEDYIQTDANIYFGSSGGALVNAQGRLVGINTLIYGNNAEGDGRVANGGISLATPSNLATFVMDDLIRYGKVVRGWLGVSVDILRALEESGEITSLLLVTGLTTGGPAEQAGIQTGDVIVSLDGEGIDDGRIAMHRIARLRPGEVVTVGIKRGDEEFAVEAVVGTRDGVTG